MESDCAQGSECGLVERNFSGRALGDSRHKQARDARNFSMNGKTGSGTSDTIPRLNICYAFPDGNHGASAAVSGALWLVKARAHGLNGREKSIALHFADDVSHEIRTGFRLLQQILAREFGRSALSAGRNNRRG